MKRRTALQGISLCGASAIVNCGRGIGSLVSPNVTSQGIDVVSGRTDSAVPDLSVTQVPDGMRLVALEYLTLVTSKTGKILLWPNDADLPVAFTQSLAYSNSSSSMNKMIRFDISVRRVGLILNSVLRRPDIQARIEHVVQVINTAQSSVRYVLDDYSADVIINIRFDANDPELMSNRAYAAVARVSYSSRGIITQGAIIFPSADHAEFVGWFETVLTHEIGHTLGLSHSPSGASGMMSPALINAGTDFTSQEKLILKMMYGRLPGTQLRGETEYEGLVQSSADEMFEKTIVCS